MYWDYYLEFLYQYQSWICSRPNLNNVNVIKLSGDCEHLCAAWLVFGQEFNAPDTYVQTVKLVIESHVLNCTPLSQRLWADLGKVKWTSVSSKIVLIPPVVVVLLRRLVGASSATWAWCISRDCASLGLLQKLTDSVEHFEWVHIVLRAGQNCKGTDRSFSRSLWFRRSSAAFRKGLVFQCEVSKLGSKGGIVLTSSRI